MLCEYARIHKHACAKSAKKHSVNTYTVSVGNTSFVSFASQVVKAVQRKRLQTSWATEATIEHYVMRIWRIYKHACANSAKKHSVNIYTVSVGGISFVSFA